VSVLIACENTDDRAGFIAIEAVESVSKKAIESFAKRRILANQEVHTDGLHANKGVTPHVTHISKVTPPEIVDEWLPWVHIAISNLKCFY
jgi:hypothetical protein